MYVCVRKVFCVWRNFIREGGREEMCVWCVRSMCGEREQREREREIYVCVCVRERERERERERCVCVCVYQPSSK